MSQLKEDFYTMNVGANTFGLRTVFYGDFDRGLQQLKEAGITSLEVCVEFPSDPANMPDFPKLEGADVMAAGIFTQENAPARIQAMRDAGFTVIGVHPMAFVSKPQEILDMIPLLISFAKENHIEYYASSPMKDADALQEFIPAYKEASSRLAAEGITYMIHNHELEVKKINGRSGLDLLLSQCPDLKIELDVGWVTFAGEDPIELMEKYKDHLGVIHLKDLRADACEENRDSCFTAVGEGAIPLKEIIAKAKALGLGDHCLVIDQDASNGKMIDDVRTGVFNISK